MVQIKSFLKLIFAPLLAFLVSGLSQEMIVESISTWIGIVTLIPIIAEAIKDKWDLKDTIIFWNIKAMKVITWALSIGLVWLSWFLGYAFESFTYIMLFGYGLGAGLVTNEYFTLDTVKALLNAIFSKRS